jgi:hypothetical protein
MRNIHDQCAHDSANIDHGYDKQTIHLMAEGEFAREKEVRAERLARRQTLGQRPSLGR